MSAVPAPFAFSLPSDRYAREPAERRGLARDHVRLLLLDRATGRVAHERFDRIGEVLRAGDLLVVNASRTIPASLEGCSAPSGPCLEVRLAERLPDGSWLALLRCRRDNPFDCGLAPGMALEFGHGLTARVEGSDERIPRLWRLRFPISGTALLDLVYRLGRPVRYDHAAAPWGLDDYQTVYATEPGSAEMPSAGRAFTWRVLLELRRRGIGTAPVLLHAGLSSYLDDALDATHPMSEEEYVIGEAAAAAINAARGRGGRVIAVGTTVVRALESAAGEGGRVRARRGYTRLRIDASHVLRAVEGLLTGFHEPEASHLDLLTAFAPPDVLRAAYEEAVREGYLWHEFGDLSLIV